ncbi:MAG TPA: amidase [Solirubrobacteraceae bacterium]|nr:amidase [Solirubrobacteraceae bacterium]
MSVPPLSATELVAAYRARELSPVEVADATLERIEAADGELNAFCLVDADAARVDARASETRWQRGEPAGPLDGVPVAVKDLLVTKGWPTLRGSTAIDASGPWEDDAPVVASLRRSGAVLPGKTTTPELGWKGVTDSALEGVTRNPWDPARTPGGSSGGSSAALAAGMVPLALGTDGGGSIRIPCAFCGLPGLKPTFGRVPAWPASPFGPVSHVGPMARTVADLALLLDVIAAPDARDWQQLPPAARSFGAGLEDGVAGLRIAFSPELGFAAVDPEIAGLVAQAAFAFAALGAHVELADPGFADPRGTFDVLWSTGAARAIAMLPDAGGVDPGLAEIAAQGRAYSGLDYLTACGERDQLAIAMSRFHEDWDLLLTPALPIAAFAAGREVPEGSADPRWPGWTPFTYPFNLTQQPAATVPCGFTSGGLPAGLQIVGARHADALVLRAARSYERAHPQPTVAAVSR